MKDVHVTNIISLTMCIWDALNVNENQTKQPSNDTRGCLIHGFLLECGVVVLWCVVVCCCVVVLCVCLLCVRGPPSLNYAIIIIVMIMVFV